MGHVYFIGEQDTAFVKIGATAADNPYPRLGSLSTANPRNLYFHLTAAAPSAPATFALEAALHIVFRGDHISREWFKVPDGESFDWWVGQFGTPASASDWWAGARGMRATKRCPSCVIEEKICNRCRKNNGL